MAWQFYLATIKEKKLVKILNVETMDTRDEQELRQGEPTEDIIEVPLDEDHPTRIVKVNFTGSRGPNSDSRVSSRPF